MRAILMTNDELLNHTNQVERDFNRLYREWDNERKYQTVLYEKLCYLRYLCKQRGIHI